MDWDNSRAVDLMIRGARAYHEGDKSYAVSLMDQAIELAESAGSKENRFQFRINKAATLSPGRQPPELVQLLKQQLAVYIENGDRVEQLNAYMNLAGASGHAGDVDAALVYLAEAEHVITSLRTDPGAQSWRSSFITLGAYLDLRSADIERARQYFTGTKQG